MSDETKATWVTFLMGVFIGMCLTGIIANIPENGPRNLRKLQDVCEKSLPRNQNCKIVFVPEQAP